MTTEIQIYSALLSDIKDRISHGQFNAVQKVNTELIEMYWDIGRMIHDRQQKDGWGARIIPQLARDIVNELPEIKGFSERNLKRMLRFYREYRSPSSTDQIKESSTPIVPQLVAQLPWGHNMLLIERVKNRDERFWYAEQATIQGWSRNSLLQLAEY